MIKTVSADLDTRMSALRELLRELAPVAVAFSGGVDSTFLLKVARDTLGDGVVALTADAPVYPRSEINEAISLAKQIGAKHVLITIDQMQDSEFTANSPSRCYTCRSILYARLLEEARRRRLRTLVDGANADDAGDYRPGMRAARELGVRSPLLELGITKTVVRDLSRLLDLPTAEKPSFACLASRIPYGTEITVENLSMVERAEQFLHGLDFPQARVRWHGNVARIEVPANEIARLCQDDIRIAVLDELKRIGFKYVALDLEGYRSGSMNEELDG